MTLFCDRVYFRVGSTGEASERVLNITRLVKGLNVATGVYILRPDCEMLNSLTGHFYFHLSSPPAPFPPPSNLDIIATEMIYVASVS